LGYFGHVATAKGLGLRGRGGLAAGNQGQQQGAKEHKLDEMSVHFLFSIDWV
jgi:hypothetical protein